MAAPPIPGIPYLQTSVPGVQNSITCAFQTTTVSGLSQTFRLIYSPVNSPTGGIILDTNQLNGDTWVGGPLLVPSAVTLSYFFASSSANGQTVFSSAFVYNPGATGPPSGPTTTPTLSLSGQNALQVTFNAVGVISTLPLTVLCNASTSPSMTNAITCQVLLQPGPVYTATATGLTPNTTYYFSTIASNGVLPNQNSTVSAGFLTLPSTPTDLVAPGVPFLVGIDGAQIVVNFDVTPVPSVTPTYTVLYNTVNDPNAPGGGTNTCFNVDGNTWASGPFGTFNTGTNWYIFARASAEGQSATSAAFVYNSSAVGPPSRPTSTPVVVSVTNSTATVSFNTIGITGTPPFVPVCSASVSPSGPFDIACELQVVSANNYQATATLLDANTSYYFQTFLTNGVLPNQTSAVSAAVVTANNPVASPPFATVVEATQITMRFEYPLGLLTQSRSGTLFWGSASPPVNSVQAVYLGVIQGSPTWEATVYGLTPGRTYYFKGQYSTFAPSIVVQQATNLGNTFDLGYMPPRGWATPNPVIVRGVSQPWRQT